jgi:hypothetical protein
MGSTLEDRASARPRAQPAMGSGAVASSATQRATQTSPTTATHRSNRSPLSPALPSCGRNAAGPGSGFPCKSPRPNLRTLRARRAAHRQGLAGRGRSAAPHPITRAKLEEASSLRYSASSTCPLAPEDAAVCPGRIREIAGRVTGRYARATISRLQRADPAAAPKARSVSAPSAPDSQSQAPAGPLAT